MDWGSWGEALRNNVVLQRDQVTYAGGEAESATSWGQF